MSAGDEGSEESPLAARAQAEELRGPAPLLWAAAGVPGWWEEETLARVRAIESEQEQERRWQAPVVEV